MVIKKIYNLVRNGWRGINTEQKLSIAGMVTGMIMIYYAFLYVYPGKYAFYIAASGYILAMFCILCYSLFKYFPIFERSKQKIPQKTISDYANK